LNPGLGHESNEQMDQFIGANRRHSADEGFAAMVERNCTEDVRFEVIAMAFMRITTWMEGNSVTTRHGNWLKEQLYLDYCATDYVIVQRNKERTFKKKL
jgi:hypothetical protein